MFCRIWNSFSFFISLFDRWCVELLLCIIQLHYNLNCNIGLTKYKLGVTATQSNWWVIPCSQTDQQFTRGLIHSTLYRILTKTVAKLRIVLFGCVFLFYFTYAIKVSDPSNFQYSELHTSSALQITFSLEIDFGLYYTSCTPILCHKWSVQTA